MAKEHGKKSRQLRIRVGYSSDEIVDRLTDCLRDTVRTWDLPLSLHGELLAEFFKLVFGDATQEPHDYTTLDPDPTGRTCGILRFRFDRFDRDLAVAADRYIAGWKLAGHPGKISTVAADG